MNAVIEKSLGFGFGFRGLFSTGKEVYPPEICTGISPYPMKMPHNGLPLKA